MVLTLSPVHMEDGIAQWVKGPTEKPRQSSPRCGKGFFSHSQLPVQTLYDVRTAAVCSRLHLKNHKHSQPYLPVFTHENTTLTCRNG